VFEGTWAEYVEARNRESQATDIRQTREKWSDEQRHARREERRTRREREAREQELAEMEIDIHRLEEQLKMLQTEIEAATEAQQSMRIYELGTLYAGLETQLREKMDHWAELAG
jgi:hypothetical protein